MAEKHLSDASGGTIQLNCGFQALRLSAMIGVYEAERLQAQELVIGLRLHYGPVKLSQVLAQDDVSQALDYATAAALIRHCVGRRHHQLLEFLAGQILESLRSALPDCIGIDLKLEKPQALPDAAASCCELAWRAGI